MTQPKRLLDSSSNGGLRDLLRSGLDDAPGPGALPKVALTLGISAGSMAASSGALASGSVASAKVAVGAHAATAAGQAALAAGSSATGAGLTLATLGKSLLVSMLAAGSLSAGVIVVQDKIAEPAPRKPTPALVAQPSVPTPVEPTPARATRSKAPALPARGDELAGDASQTSAPVDDLKKRAAGAPARAHAGSGSAEPARGALGAEVERIDSVRRALDSNDAPRALSELESYERSRTLGVLDREALLLRIEALVRQREFGQAKHLAREYLRRFPNDAHAPRMHALVAESAPSVARLPDE